MVRSEALGGRFILRQSRQPRQTLIKAFFSVSCEEECVGGETEHAYWRGQVRLEPSMYRTAQPGLVK